MADVLYIAAVMMVLCPVQESSYCFWPQGSEVGAQAVYGKVTVTIKKLSCHGDIIERRLGVVEDAGSVPRVVTILQLTSWSPREVPHPSGVLELVELLGKAQRSRPSRHTIIMCK